MKMNLQMKEIKRCNMIIKYEIKDDITFFSKTPCPHNCKPVPVRFNNETRNVMVGSVICQNHCKYFVECNPKEHYIICRKEI